jgi:hypothetical protein
MKNKTIITGIFAIGIFALSAVQASGQAFHQGSFQLNLSEGWSFSRYTTNDLNTKAIEGGGYYEGDRDPFSLEYGLSSHWGIGVSSGIDIFQINPSAMYAFSTPVNKVKSTSSEFTFDCSYHFLLTEKADLSVVASFGTSSVSFKGNISDNAYQYTAMGGIIRLGVHARYYIWKHFGILAMLSTYSSTDSPLGVKCNAVGSNYSTSIRGASLEFGMCYRFKK